MPPKKKGSKKGSKKKKSKKILEDPLKVRKLLDLASKGDAAGLNVMFEGPVADRRFDFQQLAGESIVRACENGHVDAVSAIIEAGCDVNTLNGKGLIKAAAAGKLAVAQLLYEKQADLNIKGSFTENTALQMAAWNKQLAMTQFLLTHGAAVDQQCHPENCGTSNGWAALHYAADQGHLDVVKCLVEVGNATVDLPTTSGDTALAIAAEHGRFDVVRYLVNVGADIHARRRGLNVVQWCIYRANHDTVQFLVSYGAKPDLRVKTLWFDDPESTLECVIKKEFSAPIYEKVDMAIYRGEVILRERSLHTRILAEVHWEDKPVYDPFALEPAPAAEIRHFPKNVVHLISTYEL